MCFYCRYSLTTTVADVMFTRSVAVQKETRTERLQRKGNRLLQTRVFHIVLHFPCIYCHSLQFGPQKCTSVRYWLWCPMPTATGETVFQLSNGRRHKRKFRLCSLCNNLNLSFCCRFYTPARSFCNFRVTGAKGRIWILQVSDSSTVLLQLAYKASTIWHLNTMCSH